MRISAEKRTILFLVGNRRFYFSSLDYVIEDFLEDQKEMGRGFSREDLEELNKMRNGDYFCKGQFYREVRRYALPYLR